MKEKLESKNGIIGFAIGDAMGVPVEFMNRNSLQNNPVTKMLGYMSHNMPKGSWSDDTSMTLATVDAIIKDKDINCTTIADNFLKWAEEAKYTPTGNVFDIGRTCLQAILRYEKNECKAEECGGTGEYDNGNGSLMRMVPIIYYKSANSFSNIGYNTVRRVSSITHSNPVSILGCYIYVLFGKCLMDGWNFEQAYEYIQSEWYEEYFDEETIDRYKRILKGNIRELKADDISSSGYVVHTLEATFWTLLNSYDEAVIKAINLGDDADTVGGCVGGLAGIFYGVDSINEEWKKDLIKYNYIDDMCKKFDIVLQEMYKKSKKEYDEFPCKAPWNFNHLYFNKE